VQRLPGIYLPDGDQVVNQRSGSDKFSIYKPIGDAVRRTRIQTGIVRAALAILVVALISTAVWLWN